MFTLGCFVVLLAMVLGPMGSDGLSSIDPPSSKAWVEARVAILVDPNATFEARCQAEDQLREHPSEFTLDVLAPMLDKFVESTKCGTFRTNSSNLEHRGALSNAPLNRQIDLAVNRIWHYVIESLDSQIIAPRMIDILKQRPPQIKLHHAITALDHKWSADAEPVLRELAREGMDSWAAITVLGRHGVKSVKPEIDRLLLACTTESQMTAILSIVSDPAYISRWGRDLQCSKLGFEMLGKIDTENDSMLLHGVNLIGPLGKLAEQEFLTPFSSQGGESDESVKLQQQQHYRAAVDKALQWWRDNSAKYQ
jgi:hypothetical protein